MGCVHRLGQSQRGGDFAGAGGRGADSNSALGSRAAHEKAQAQEAVSHRPGMRTAAPDLCADCRRLRPAAKRRNNPTEGG